MKKIDVNAPGITGLLYGIPVTVKESTIVFYPIPFAGTTSFGKGAEHGYQILLNASTQVEIQSEPLIAGLSLNNELVSLHKRCTSEFKELEQHFAGVDKLDSKLLNKITGKVTGICEQVDKIVQREITNLISKGKIVVAIGGDHGSVKGSMMTYAEKAKSKNKNLSVIHLDAHYDFRKTLDGTPGSHACAMRYVLDRYPEINNFVTIGPRSFCEEETAYIFSQGKRIANFPYYEGIAKPQFQGLTWEEVVSSILFCISNEEVYVTLDIDVLKAYLCPGTGTPQWGGLTVEQVIYLLERIAMHHRIVGADINEVSHGHSNNVMNGVVAAELAYRLAGIIYGSQRKK